MKKVFFLASALAVLAACGNHDDLPVPVPEQEAVSIDLRSMNYEGLMTLLSEQASLKNITFTDGTLSRNVSELVASNNVDPNQVEMLTFNSANTKDSLDLTVTPEYVSVRMTANGKQMAYLAFADPNQQNEIASLYEEVIPATRSGAPAVTRGSNNGSFSLNLTEISASMSAQGGSTGGFVLPAKALRYQSPTVTRGWLSNLFAKVVAAFNPAPAPVVKTPTVDIYLMREKGANPLTHEMNWQVNDVISSLKDVQSNVNFNVHIENCDFQGSKTADRDLPNFRSWVERSKYSGTKGIFILCRWGGWDEAIGKGYVGTYDVNGKEASFLITATVCFYPYTMAHEVGHNFGAKHVEVKWWQIFSGDLMGADNWLGSGKHKDDANRAEIKRRLTLN